MMSIANMYPWTPPEHTPEGLSFPQNKTDPTILQANENNPYMSMKQMVQAPQVTPALREQHPSNPASKNIAHNAILR